MAFDDNNYLWEGQILSRRPGTIVLMAEDELVDDVPEGSCVWPCEWVRVWCDGTDQNCDEDFDNDCDEVIDEDTIGYDWTSSGEGYYDLTSAEAKEEEEEEKWRREWREGPLAALRVFVKIVDDEAKWEALVRRFPAIHDEWEEMAVEDPRWRRLRRLMDPPQWLREKLPLSSGRHYGAWQKWKGSRDLNFADWIIFEFDWAQALTADELFDEVESRLQRGYFDI